MWRGFVGGGGLILHEEEGIGVGVVEGDAGWSGGYMMLSKTINSQDSAFSRSFSFFFPPLHPPPT